jgi:hypothetical protein
MERRETQLPQTEDDLASVLKRLLDLERLFAAVRVPKILDDLDDVEVIYSAPAGGTPGGSTPPADGDVLVYNADRSLWVPGPSGGRRVAWAGEIVRASSAWTTKTETAYVDSGGVTAVEIVSGDGVLVKVNAAGVWLVSARIESAAACSKFEVRGTNWSLPGDMSCLPNDAIRYDGAANFTDQSISGQFWLPEDGTVKVVTDAADCAVYLRLALYMETPIDVGTCE